MNAALRRLALRPLAAATAVALLGAGCRASPAPASPPYTGTLTLVAPARITAGEPALVRALAGAPDGATGSVTALGSYGARVFPLRFAGGEARLVLPEDVTRRSGQLRLDAALGAVRAQADLDILPGAPAEPLLPLVGARSIVADGVSWAAVIVLPVDRLGNPVAEGALVEIRAQRPNASIDPFETPVRHLLAWTRVRSGILAGRTIIAARAGGASGPERDLFETAGWPVPFTITASPAEMVADGRQQTTLRTSALADAHGNTVPDGTAVIFNVAQAGRVRQITAPTINGVAVAGMPAASEPGVSLARGSVYGVASPPIEIRFGPGPAVGEFAVTARPDAADGALILLAGPILGPLRQYAPDGSRVEFRVTGSDGRERTIDGACDNGYARIALRLTELGPGDYVIEARAGAARGEARISLP